MILFGFGDLSFCDLTDMDFLERKIFDNKRSYNYTQFCGIRNYARIIYWHWGYTIMSVSLPFPDE